MIVVLKQWRQESVGDSFVLPQNARMPKRIQSAKLIMSLSFMHRFTHMDLASQEEEEEPQAAAAVAIVLVLVHNIGF